LECGSLLPLWCGWKCSIAHRLTRTVVEENFRAPVAEQFSFEVQRQMARDTVFRVGYVGTKGTGLF